VLFRDNGAQRGAHGRGELCDRNIIDFSNEHVDFQLGSEVYNSSRVAEPAIFVSQYDSGVLRYVPNTSVVPYSNDGVLRSSNPSLLKHQYQKLYADKSQHLRGLDDRDVHNNAATGSVVGVPAGDGCSRRLPAVDKETYRVIPQSLLDQERDLETQIKVIGKESEEFKRTFDGQRSERSDTKSITQKSRTGYRAGGQSEVTSGRKLDKNGKRDGGINSVPQSYPKGSHHRRGQSDEFYHCDNEVAVHRPLSDRRCDSFRNRSSSSNSCSDGEQSDLLSGRRREVFVHDRDLQHDRSISNRRRCRSPAYASRTYRRDENERERRSRNKAVWIKPEKFNGHGSFETFLAQFENCAVYNEWNRADKVAYLRWSLTGTAAQLLWGSEELPYEELFDKLKRRFSGKGMEEKFQTELRCCRRNKGESLRELGHDIRRLMTLAYPEKQSSLSEHIARDAFLSALGDPDFELKIREREPTDLDGALAIAQRYEVFKGAVESSAATRPRLNRFVTEVQCDEVSFTEDDRGVSRRQDPVTGTPDGSKRKWSAKSENIGEPHWKDVMRRLGNLESAKQEVEQRPERLTAENVALIESDSDIWNSYVQHRLISPMIKFSDV